VLDGLARRHPVPGERAGRRARPRYGPKPSPPALSNTDRGLRAVVAAVALLGFAGLQSATQAAYACSTVWQAGTDRIARGRFVATAGYVQPDMGQGHVGASTKITHLLPAGLGQALPEHPGWDHCHRACTTRRTP
ncbi:MAG: hypothetical protein WKF78_07750, partial [Candidatus Limnocylindrales bacterium]